MEREAQRMRTAKSSSGLLRVVVVVMALAVPSAVFAQAFQVNCGRGGDALGYAVATNGDFNGDGVNDIAIGSPCFYVRKFARAGRVLVLDGRNGKVIFRKKGGRIGQWMGASVSFLPDLNGDGRDEIAFGSPGYDVSGFEQGDPLLGTKESAGRVDVYQKKKRRMRVFGVTRNAGFGERIAPTSDIDGDGKRDFLISASTDSNPDGSGGRPGRVWLVSGRNGDLLAFRLGPKAGKNYGRALASTPDLDGDGLMDFLAGSDELNIPNVFNSGAVDVVSTADFEGDPLLQVVGARSDRLGRTVDYAGFVNDDDIPDFIAGALGADDNGIKKSGLVTLYSLNGNRLWVRQDSEVQEKAYFGDSVATVGDINGDGITDFVAGAPGFDIFVDKLVQADAGRIVTLSGEDGEPIWSLNGDHLDDEFGYALAGKIDFNLDEIPDVVVGTPGDGPLGRRGAGSVRILSGIDGTQLLLTPGRRGLETRMVTVVPETSTSARLRAFNRNGHGQALNAKVLDGVRLGELSITVLNDRNNPPPKVVQVAVAGGRGANKTTVEVYQMGSKGKRVDSFEAFPGENYGVECAAGEANGDPFEELVCAQGSSDDGNVMIRVFRRLDEQQPFYPIYEFQAFASTDMLNPLIPINADGANVAIGDVTGGSEEEIIVGTNRGVPLVKIFTREGAFIRQFLAYDPVPSSGVDVATMDPSGASEKRILTAPREGEALIKLFAGTGERVLAGRDNIPVSVNARPLPYMGGARVAAADVDLDDKQEMIVFVPSPVGTQFINAYELDNKKVLHFEPFNPALLATIEGGAVGGTDRFVRN